MTLKEFAAEQGVSESTARSWKLRGQIAQYTEGGPWHFTELSQRNARTATEDCNADVADFSVAIDPDSFVPSRPYVRSSSGVTPERVAELRQEIERKKAASVNVTRGEFQDLQAQVDSLRAMVHALATERQELCDRVAELEGANPGQIANDAITKVFGGKSNYTGSASSIGEQFDDGPPAGFVW